MAQLSMNKLNLCKHTLTTTTYIHLPYILERQMLSKLKLSNLLCPVKALSFTIAYTDADIGGANSIKSFKKAFKKFKMSVTCSRRFEYVNL